MTTRIRARGSPKSAHPRARWVVALFAATVVIDVVAVGSGLAEIGLLTRVVNGAFITEAEAMPRTTLVRA